MNDFLQENKLLCSLWGVGSDKSSVSRDAAAHPSPDLAQGVWQSHPTQSCLGKPLWRAWAVPSHLLLLPDLPHCQDSFPPSHTKLCQQSPPGIKSHFSAQQLAKQQTWRSRGCWGLAGILICYGWTHSLMLLKRFNVWYSPNEIKGTKNWKQGMFTITGTWRAVMSLLMEK